MRHNRTNLFLEKYMIPLLEKRGDDLYRTA